MPCEVLSFRLRRRTLYLHVDCTLVSTSITIDSTLQASNRHLKLYSKNCLHSCTMMKYSCTETSNCARECISNQCSFALNSISVETLFGLMFIHTHLIMSIVVLTLATKYVFLSPRPLSRRMLEALL